MGLAGDWYNELGSHMTLVVDGDGGLSGTYCSPVGDATGDHVLAGRYDTDPPSGEGTTVGWAVSWSDDASSTTAWGGQYFDDDSGERIITNWLLTSSTTADSVWESTNIGNDTFTRDDPSDAQIAKARVMSVCSPRLEHIVAKKKKKSH
ncbi:Tamavidin2, avidin-like biotin-binding proteins from an edible mushroom [Mycena belliarum]|uniref:Tamavidin2, avidin-like biotin-binding proteins from an edible mushroom n=1 Tax=Mycena belliarum TaxID=1033014 RepID=A0AAD6XII2_9AGAR|nr:Tamavidin2, avidin-like biotin-binding proteins from an edible mushroom [Mycena belliae]